MCQGCNKRAARHPRKQSAVGGDPAGQVGERRLAAESDAGALGEATGSSGPGRRGSGGFGGALTPPTASESTKAKAQRPDATRARLVAVFGLIGFASTVAFAALRRWPRMFAISATWSRSSRPAGAGGNLPQRSVIVGVGPPFTSADLIAGRLAADEPEPLQWREQQKGQARLAGRFFYRAKRCSSFWDDNGWGNGALFRRHRPIDKRQSRKMNLRKRRYETRRPFDPRKPQ
jgi:hypothetical protein